MLAHDQEKWVGPPHNENEDAPVNAWVDPPWPHKEWGRQATTPSSRNNGDMLYCLGNIYIIVITLCVTLMVFCLFVGSNSFMHVYQSLFTERSILMIFLSSCGFFCFTTCFIMVVMSIFYSAMHCLTYGLNYSDRLNYNDIWLWPVKHAASTVTSHNSVNIVTVFF